MNAKKVSSALSLHDIPPAPEGKTGWPWTVTSSPLRVPLSAPVPTISVVVPSYNQGRFIEETLRSILLQNYPATEILVLDGGSTDETISILERYDRWLTYWVSERDHGQSDAINKGLARATGELFNWVNSDDYLAPGAFWAIARAWQKGPVDLISGGCVTIEEPSKRPVYEWRPQPPKRAVDFFAGGRVVLPQPSTFLSTECLRAVGGVREDLHLIMDWELYLRMTLRRGHLRSLVVPEAVAVARNHENTKTHLLTAGFRREAIGVLSAIEQPLGVMDRWQLVRWRRWLELQEEVVQLLRERDRSKLAHLLFRRPDAALLRSYWGACLRVLGWRKS